MSRALAASKSAAGETSRATERHYSVSEVAEMWKLSPDTVRRLFQAEPGVLVLGEAERKYGKRSRYLTLRIPESVLERVHRRQSNI